jgi:hypothetical protein
MLIVFLARLLLQIYSFIVFQLGADGENHIRVGKLNLVDLAGSERQAKTQAAVSICHWSWSTSKMHSAIFV